MKNKLMPLIDKILLRKRAVIEICQTQPVKMTWCALKYVMKIMTYLRGQFKREYVEDIHLLAGDDHFADQTLYNRLALFE